MVHPFANVPDIQLESLNALSAQFRCDTAPEKTNLMVGVFKSDNGGPHVLSSVSQAKAKIFSNSNWHHEYRGTHIGSQRFRNFGARLFFGEDSHSIKENRIISMQSLGASGACHMAAKFLKDHYGPWTAGSQARVFIPRESWGNHPNVFEYLGIKVSQIPYLDNQSKMFDYVAFRTAIGSIPQGSVLVLQSAAQNPTGCDPTLEQWHEIASLCHERGHLVLFDVAYPGFASGNIDIDLESVRIFDKMGVPLIIATTYGKCFGLYCERVGALFVVAPDEAVGKRIEKQMKFLARAETGAQPDFGSLIVETILSDAELRSLWQSELREMAEQLKYRRQQLQQRLVDLKTPGIWSHITLQNGMFSHIGFTGEQIRILREDYHVYLQDNGRLSIAGLNSSNLEHVARSVHAVIMATTEAGDMHARSREHL